MTYQEVLDTIKETMTDQGISVGDMAKYFVDHQQELEISDRDLGIILAGLDMENGEGLQYITPEAKEALQSIINGDKPEGEGSEEQPQEPAPEDEGDGEGEEELTDDVSDESDECAEEGEDTEEPEDTDVEEDQEEVSEDGDDRESMKKMFYN